MTKIAAISAASILCVGAAAAHAQTPSVSLASTRIILLVDSGSGVQQHYQRIRTGLTDFLAAMPEDVEIGIVSCGGQMRLRLAPTTDRAKQREAAESFSPDGGANAFLDALVESDQRLLKSAADKRPVFVVIATDGSSNSEPRIDAYNRFLNDFRQRRGMAHAVVLRTNQMGLASQVLENLTQNTGGTMQVIALSNGVPDALKQIAERVAAGR